MSNADIIVKAAKAFDKARKRLFDTNAELLLLRVSATANEYETVETLTDSWYFDSEKNELYIAKDAFDFQEVMEQSTHAQPGEDIYVMVPDDIRAPDTKAGGRVYWTIGCEKFSKRGQFNPIY